MLEAMYFGVPVISTASAGAKVIIQQDVTGYILDTFDTSCGRKRLSILMRKYKKHGGRCPAIYSKEFNMVRHCQKIRGAI